MGLDSFKDSLASLHQGKINVDVDVYEQAQYHTSWDWLMLVLKKINLHLHPDTTPETYEEDIFDEIWDIIAEKELEQMDTDLLEIKVKTI